MSSFLWVHPSISQIENRLSVFDRGKVFVIEISSGETMFLLCAFEIGWNDLKALMPEGQLLTYGVFSVNENGHPWMVLKESREGWPSRGQLAYARADLRDHLESTQVELRVESRASP